MQRYLVLKRVMLGFNGPQDQADIIIEPGEALEADGHTIWLVRGTERIESITVGYAIDVWLRDGSIRKA